MDVWVEAKGRRSGAGIAWYEETGEEGGRIFLGRRDFRTAGQRRETTRDTYHGRYRSFERARSGWRSKGFGIGGGHEAYDAELATLAYGLVHLHDRGETG